MELFVAGVIVGAWAALLLAGLCRVAARADKGIAMGTLKEGKRTGLEI